jgi:hypothetical protein
MRRIEKMILSLICGAALAVPACYDSGDRGGARDVPDAEVDPADDALEDVDEEEAPPVEDMYGPPIDTVYGPPYP